jgi:hypothetical protein
MSLRCELRQVHLKLQTAFSLGGFKAGAMWLGRPALLINVLFTLDDKEVRCWSSHAAAGIIWFRMATNLDKLALGFYRFLTTESLVVASCTPPGLAFNNCTFRPHSVLLCFEWIKQKIAVNSPHNISLLVCYKRNGECFLRGTNNISRS